MKKALVVVCCSMFIFSACQKNTTVNPDQFQKLAMSQEKRLGVIQSLGGALTASQATNLLRMDNGKTLYLKSAVIDLNAEKYTGKEVEVMGEMYRTTDGGETMDVKNIDIIDTVVIPTQDLPVWEDYSSDSLGIVLKYRNDFELNENGTLIEIKQKQPISSTVNTLIQNSSAKTWKGADIKLELLSKDVSFDLAKEMGVASLNAADVLTGGYNRSKITQKGLDAYKKTDVTGKAINYFLKNSDGTYKISFDAGEQTDALIVNQNLFYDMLASIDFKDLVTGGVENALINFDGKTTETVENPSPAKLPESSAVDQGTLDETTSISNGSISGFETFSSDGLKFSIQYPKTYYFGSVPASGEGVQTSYQFGSKPLESQPGDIKLDIVAKIAEGGKNIQYEGISMSKVASATQVSLYISKGGRIYRLSGPTAKEGLMEQMLATVKNLNN